MQRSHSDRADHVAGVALASLFQLLCAQTAWAEPANTQVDSRLQTAAQDQQVSSAPAPPIFVAESDGHTDEMLSSAPLISLGMHGAKQGMTLFERRPNDETVRLCALDCTLKLKPGLHTFGVSISGQEPVWSPEPIELKRDANLSIRYAPAQARRVGAGVVILLGAVTGTALIVGGSLSNALSSDGYVDAPNSSDAKALWGIGTAIAAVSLAASILLLLSGPTTIAIEESSESRDSRTAPRDGQHGAPGATPELSRVVWSCAPSSVKQVKLTVFTNERGEITDLNAPESWGRGARRCLHSRTTSQLLPGYAPGGWTLEFKR